MYTRSLARTGRLTHLSVDLSDTPGALAEIATVIGEYGANIVEVSHQRIFTDLPAKAVSLEVVIETRDRTHLASTIAALRAQGRSWREITQETEISKGTAQRAARGLPKNI